MHSRIFRPPVEFRRRTRNVEGFLVLIESAKQYPDDKVDLYALLKKELQAMVEGVEHPIPNLANASALLWLAFKDINWVGFYLMQDGQLILGPFQGKPACIYIPVGKGVCGTAVAENRTVRVPNVYELTGKIE